jgi:hypothetical protein
MMRLRRASMIAALAAIVACGCNRPSAEIRRECDTAKRWLNLDKNDAERCLRDTAFRENLRRQGDEAFAAQLATTHNRDRSLLKLRGMQASSFTRIARPSELPVQALGGEAADEKHIGQRYVVRTTVAWSESLDPSFSPHVFLDASGSDPAMVGTDALDQYQHRFLSTHCWPGGPPPTLCEGDVYIEIRRDPRGLFVEAQVVGADFVAADAKAVLTYVARPRSVSRSPETGPKAK